MSSGLRRRASRAATWSFIEAFGRMGLQFVLSLVLARLISPADFGGFAVISLVVTLAGYLVDAGLTQAIIRKRDVSPIDLSTVFWFNIVVGSCLALFFFVEAEFLLRFFRQQNLVMHLVLASLSIPLLAFQSVHRALLARELRFRALGTISIVSAVASGGVAIAMAYVGYGLWALVWQLVLFNLVSGIFTIYAVRHLKLRGFKFSALAELWEFGIWVVLGSLLNALRGGVLTTVVARNFGTFDLGLYNRAEGLRNLPQSLVVSSVERVLLPAMAEAANQKNRLERAMVGVAEPFMFLGAWILLALASTSDLVVSLLYGDQWIGAADYLPYLCYAGVLLPMSILNVQLMLALGESRGFFWLDFVKAVVAICLFALVARYGVKALAMVQVPFAFFSWVINTRTASRVINFGFWRQFSMIFPVVAGGAIATLGTYFFRKIIVAPLLLEIFSTLVFWSLIYLAAVGMMRYGLIVRSCIAVRSVLSSS